MRKQTSEIHFIRRPGKFLPKVKLIKRNGGNQKPERFKGLIHAAVKWRKNPSVFVPFAGKIRITGDLPNAKKALKNWKPKTVRGIAAKSALQSYRRIGSAAEKTVLLAESAAMRTTKTLGRTAINRLKLKVENAAYSGNGGTQTAAEILRAAGIAYRLNRTAREARRVKTVLKYGGHSSFKLSKKCDGVLYKLRESYKKALENYRGKYSEHRAFRITGRTGGVKRLAKKEIKLEKRKIKILKAKFKADKNKKSIPALLNKRKINYGKAKIKLKKLEKKSAETELRFRKKIFRTNKRLLRSAKFALAKDIGKRAGTDVFLKVRQAAGNNDFVAFAAGARHLAASIKHPKTGAQKLRDRERKISQTEKKLTKAKGKLQAKKKKLQANKKNVRLAGKRGRIRRKTLKSKFSNGAAAVEEALKNPSAALSQLAAKAVTKVIVPILGKILLVVIPVMMVFFMFIGGGGGAATAALGVYWASDTSLTKASEYYSKLAFDFNGNILKIPTDDWKTALSALGVNTSGYDAKPQSNNWNTAPCASNFDLNSDYNPYKLWSFITAHYFDFAADEEDEQKDWVYNSDVENLINRLFSLEYEFKHVYDYTPAWNEEVTRTEIQPVEKTRIVPKPTYNVNGVIIGWHDETETYYEDEEVEVTETVHHEATADLYYTVNRKMTFDEAIQTLLNAEQYEFYEYMSEEDGVRGGHQTMRSPLVSDFQTLISIGRVRHINGFDIQRFGSGHCAGIPGGEHKGIDIWCDPNEAVYAAADGIISNANGSVFELAADNLPDFNDETKTYSATVKYSNARLSPGIANGTAVTKGQRIGTVTADKSCGDIGAAYYLHLQITVDGANADPYLLID